MCVYVRTLHSIVACVYALADLRDKFICCIHPYMDQIDHRLWNNNKNNSINKSWHTFKVKWIYFDMIFMSCSIYGLILWVINLISAVLCFYLFRSLFCDRFQLLDSFKCIHIGKLIVWLLKNERDEGGRGATHIGCFFANYTQAY